MTGYRKIDLPLILYGAGELGQMAKSALAKAGLLLGNGQFMDQSLKPDTFLPASVPENYRRKCLVAVCVASEPFWPIKAKLNAMGYTDVVSIYDIFNAYPQVGLTNGWYHEMTEHDQLMVNEVEGRFEDEQSWHDYQSFVYWHTERIERLTPPVDTEGRYFIPEVMNVLHERECFVDGGAYHGDVTAKFLDLVHGRFKEVHMIEPDARNLSALFKNPALAHYRPIGSERVHIKPVALSRVSSNAEFRFGMGYMSKLSPDIHVPGPMPVRTLAALDIPVTFLKLHIEGAEYDVLSGSMAYLCDRRPILAVTVYHTLDGLWGIEKLLMDGLKDYEFYFRNHAYQGQVAVLYAVPCERKNTKEMLDKLTY